MYFYWNKEILTSTVKIYHNNVFFYPFNFDVAVFITFPSFSQWAYLIGYFLEKIRFYKKK